MSIVPARWLMIPLAACLCLGLGFSRKRDTCDTAYEMWGLVPFPIRSRQPTACLKPTPRMSSLSASEDVSVWQSGDVSVMLQGEHRSYAAL